MHLSHQVSLSMFYVIISGLGLLESASILVYLVSSIITWVYFWNSYSKWPNSPLYQVFGCRLPPPNLPLFAWLCDPGAKLSDQSFWSAEILSLVSKGWWTDSWLEGDSPSGARMLSPSCPGQADIKGALICPCQCCPMVSCSPASAYQQSGRKLPAHEALSAGCGPARAQETQPHLHHLVGFLLVSLSSPGGTNCPGCSASMVHGHSVSQKAWVSALGRRPFPRPLLPCLCSPSLMRVYKVTFYFLLVGIPLFKIKIFLCEFFNPNYWCGLCLLKGSSLIQGQEINPKRWYFGIHFIMFVGLE